MFVTHHRLSSGTDGRVVYVAYTTLKDLKDCDVMALVRNIAEKYLLLQNLENTDDENGTKKSSTSKNSTKKNGTKMESMTYLDFVRIVPNEFCEQYGLTKKVLDDLPRTYRGDTTLVSKSGIVNNLKNSADITMRQLAMKKAVDAFSKQIGPVLNTIMAGWTFDQVNECIYHWSEEFAQSYGGRYPTDEAVQKHVNSTLALVMKYGDQLPFIWKIKNKPKTQN